ncbi:MAG TPA: GlsB/YeaQ/YmgE family stress response membrane protein [Pyrinomonadaceae bacterium]|jgi:uncharacterized membrane protein YeaQ/YmgE (transglycosylase-associated protein family)|nr:GlsB/YeaQ/YmgE family stress response membrane protein [Pyrinomonadaceae bacterium]
MGFIALIILGLIAGAIAKAIMPGKDPGGMIVTMLIGIAGSIIGGLLGGALLGYGGVNDAGDVSRPGFFMRLVLAVVGALVLLAVYRLIKGRSVRA